MAQQVPPGMNLQDDATGSIIASIIPCMVLSGLALIARIVSRNLQKLRLGVSDYLCTGGLLGAWVISLIIIEEAKLGLGRHAPVVPLDNVREILLTTYIGEIFYSISFAIIKISILILLREIFPGRGIRIATLVIGVIVVMWGISVLLVSIFSCNPIHGFWDILIPSKCVDSRWFFVGNSIPNILTDLAILAIPIHRVWRLQMSIASKLAVSFIFLLGGFVIVASAVRINFMLNMNPEDMTWTYQGVGLWTAVEINVAVISACLPTIRPVIRLLIPSFMTSYFSRASKVTGNKSGDFYAKSATGTNNHVMVYSEYSTYSQPTEAHDFPLRAAYPNNYYPNNYSSLERHHY